MNNIRQLLPPTFNDRAMSSNRAEAYNLNIPSLYTTKNPSWQQLTINQADELDPDVMMKRMDQNEIFAPQPDDVENLAREVMYYRDHEFDDELEHLKEQRQYLLRHLEDMNQDDFDDRLHELDMKIKNRQADLDAAQRRMREMEAENERLERELNNKPVVHHIVQPVMQRPSTPPQVVRTVIEERPRSKSPSRNILPSKIAGIPNHVESRHGYNYDKDPGASIKDSISGVRGPDLHYQSTIYHNPLIEKDEFIPQTQPMTYNSVRMPQQTSVIQQPMGLPQARVMPSQVVRPEPIRVSSSSTLMQPGIRQSGSIRAGSFTGTQSTVGRTYKINGITYTDENLPPQYAHLKG